MDLGEFCIIFLAPPAILLYPLIAAGETYGETFELAVMVSVVIVMFLFVFSLVMTRPAQRRRATGAYRRR